jgi:hypothetical protein
MGMQPLCSRRVLNELRPYRSEPMYGAAMFVAAGMISAMRSSFQPFRSASSSIDAMADQVGRNALTPAVVLAVDDSGVAVYPARLRGGGVTGDMLTFWAARTYEASFQENAVTSRLGFGFPTLAVRPPGKQDLVVLETACFPVGVNRYNRRIAIRVAQLAKST